MSADLNFATCSEDVVDTRALSSAQGLPGAFVIDSPCTLAIGSPK
jgi:hypothetical protein